MRSPIKRILLATMWARNHIPCPFQTNTLFQCVRRTYWKNTQTHKQQLQLSKKKLLQQSAKIVREKCTRPIGKQIAGVLNSLREQTHSHCIHSTVRMVETNSKRDRDYRIKLANKCKRGITAFCVSKNFAYAFQLSAIFQEYVSHGLKASHENRLQFSTLFKHMHIHEHTRVQTWMRRKFYCEPVERGREKVTKDRDRGKTSDIVAEQCDTLQYLAKIRTIPAGNEAIRLNESGKKCVCMRPLQLQRCVNPCTRWFCFSFILILFLSLSSTGFLYEWDASVKRILFFFFRFRLDSRYLNRIFFNTNMNTNTLKRENESTLSVKYTDDTMQTKSSHRMCRTV